MSLKVFLKLEALLHLRTLVEWYYFVPDMDCGVWKIVCDGRFLAACDHMQYRAKDFMSSYAIKLCQDEDDDLLNQL